MRTVGAFVLLLLFPTYAIAQSALSPGWVQNPPASLEPPTVALTPDVRDKLNSLWYVRQEKSPIDDTTNVYMHVTSKDDIRGRYGKRGRAELTIRCSERVTALYFTFADHFMTSIQQYGRVVTRIDKRPSKTISMLESTDHSALGFWRGGAAIPFIKSMFDGGTLFVRATPFNESSRDAEFDISGLESAIKPLRTACRW